MISRDTQQYIPLESPTARYRFLDLYRGLFVILMLEGHVVRELLSSGARATEAFTLHELVHGITAPGFFFGAGFAFAISSKRRWDDVISLSSGWLRRFGRAVLLLAVGYALHMPFLSLSKTFSHATGGQWSEFLAFGVLQCVGITLMALYLLLVLLKNEKRFGLLLLLGVPVLVYLTPSVVAWASSGDIPLWLRSGFTTATGSPYPLLPFAAFILCGVVVAWTFLRSSTRDQEHRFMRSLAFLGAVILVLSVALESVLSPSISDADFWTVSPNFFWARLGILFIVLSALWFLEEHLPHAIFPGWITLLGIESFFVYIFHLLILYGWVINPDWNIQAILGSSLSFGNAILVFVAFVPVIWVAARVWRWLKKRHSILHRGLIVWMIIVISYAFFFHPY